MQSLKLFGDKLYRLNEIFRLSFWNPYVHKKYCSDVFTSSKNEQKIEWVRPKRLPSFHPKNSGDLTPIEFPGNDELLHIFSESEQLRNCDNEKIKKIFCMVNQSSRLKFQAYKNRLIEKVKSHKFDTTSAEVKIAKVTAKIRYAQYLHDIFPHQKRRRVELNALLLKRRKYLKDLRQSDYKKFEWLLEKLDIVFKADPIKFEKVTRQKSITLLAELKVKKLKEEKISEHKKKLDEQKIPFLERKIKVLQWIRDQEQALNMECTVSDDEIDSCRKQMEKVALEVQERQRKGYKRKIHPYTLELYEPDEPLITEKST